LHFILETARSRESQRKDGVRATTFDGQRGAFMVNHLPKRFAIAAVLFVLSGSALAKTETCHPASEKQIAALFDRWNDSLKNG